MDWATAVVWILVQSMRMMVVAPKCWSHLCFAVVCTLYCKRVHLLFPLKKKNSTFYVKEQTSASRLHFWNCIIVLSVRIIQFYDKMKIIMFYLLPEAGNQNLHYAKSKDLTLGLLEALVNSKYIFNKTRSREEEYKSMSLRLIAWRFKSVLPASQLLRKWSLLEVKKEILCWTILFAF